jgi:methionyl-tRNA synthetase
MMNPFYVYGSGSAFIAVLVIAIWSIIWKLYAVWMAARHNHKKWFVALIILNTLGILEIIYVFYIAKKSWVSVKGDFNKALSMFK